MFRNLKTALPVLVVAGLLPSAASAACPDITALVDAGLSADVGDIDRMRELLQPPKPARPASSGFDVKSLQKAVGAKGFAVDDSQCCTGSKCVYRNGDDEVIRLKAEKGAATFLSHLRSSELEENTIAEDEATSMTRFAMAVAGISDDEVDEDSVRAAVVEETVAEEPSRTAGPSVTRRSEVFVRLARQIGGTPVEGSLAGAAIAPSGRIARLRLRWPAFDLAPGLDASRTLSRSEVLNIVAEELSALNACGTLSAVRSEIRYIPADLVEGMGDADPTEREEEPHHVGPSPYIPALKVEALPIEQAENSGVTQDAGLTLYLPLLRTQDRPVSVH